MAREEEKRVPAVGIRAGNSASASATVATLEDDRAHTRPPLTEKLHQGRDWGEKIQSVQRPVAVLGRTAGDLEGPWLGQI
jgi:hypothetical protein